MSTVRYIPGGLPGANKKSNGTRKNNQYSGQDLNSGIAEYGLRSSATVKYRGMKSLDIPVNQEGLGRKSSDSLTGP